MARSLCTLILFSVLAAYGCRREKAPTPKPLESAAAGPKTPDRLAPGELGEGQERFFGFAAPADMRLKAAFRDSVHLAGRVTPQALADYVRARVLTQHVEIGAARMVFPRVRIRGTKGDKVYRFEVIPNGLETRLVIKDVTRPKGEKGLSREERMRRAGLTPEGEPLPDLE